jgi:hypothetical protein
LLAREQANANQLLLDRRAVPTNFQILFHEIKEEKKEKTTTPKLFPAIDEASINVALAKSMPWLVPACSRDDLENAVARAGAGLFGDAKIAGIVPGATNSPFDACAFGWANAAPLQWVFEFKARTDSYTEASGFADLNSKFATYRSEEQKKRKTPEECHALLVCIRGAGQTEAHVWLEEGTEQQLRIVLLLNSKA